MRGADLVHHRVPKGPVVFIHSAKMAVCYVVDIFIKSDACVPSLSQQGLVDRLIDAKAFERRADAHELLSAFLLRAG